jgi:hypothetical protein
METGLLKVGEGSSRKALGVKSMCICDLVPAKGSLPLGKHLPIPRGPGRPGDKRQVVVYHLPCSVPEPRGKWSSGLLF